MKLVIGLYVLYYEYSYSNQENIKERRVHAFRYIPHWN